MEYRAPVETYTGKVKEVVIGKGDKAIKIGGESVLPFHFFEGSIDNPPRIALEVWDMEPTDWAEWVVEPYKDVISDPVKWANKALELGADLICLRLMSTDPAGADGSADKAADIVKQHVNKGDALYVEGKISTNSWDDKEGNKHYSTEIVCDNFLFLSPRNHDGE